MTPLGVTAAQAAMLQRITPQPALRMPLADALGHRLAGDVVARWPLPQWTAASMDGFAVHADDVRGASDAAPVTLILAGGGDAGDADPPPLVRGTAWRVATGGRVPVGADSVIRVEDTALANGEPRTANGGFVSICGDRDAARNVRPVGGDVAVGSTVLHSGTHVHAGVIAMLAAIGEAAPMVHRKPRVAILTSGNEVVSLEQIEQISSGARIADVNAPMLAALVTQAGGVPVLLGLVQDTADAMRAAIVRASDCDLILTAGGVSVGKQDHVMSVMEALGCEVVFRRVRLRPGGPTTFAVIPGGMPWLALPGNPVSAFVTFHLFAAPAIAKLAGAANGERRTAVARWGMPVQRDPVLDQYLRVTLTSANDGGPPIATSTGNQGSWVLSSIAAAEGLAVIEAGDGSVASGDEVRVLAFSLEP